MEAIKVITVNYPEIADVLMKVEVRHGDVSRTNGRIIEIEKGLPLEEEVLHLIHELIHVALQHPWRGKEMKENPILVNIAADAIANYYTLKILSNEYQDVLIRTAEVIPSDHSILVGGLKIKLKKHIEQYTLEELVELLKKYEKKLKKVKTLDDHSKWKEAKKDDRVYVQEVITKELLSRGTTGADISKVARMKAPEIVIPVRLRVKKWVNRTLGYEHTDWRRPSKRLRDVYLPRWRGAGGKVGVVLDTSGSMWGELDEALGVLVNALIQNNVRMVYLVQGDVDVKEAKWIHVKKLKHLRIKGGGGTILRKQIKEASKAGPVIVVTDGFVSTQDFTGHHVPILVISIETPIFIEDPNVEVVVWKSTKEKQR